MSAAALKNEASVVPSSRARRTAREVLIVDCHDSFVYNLVQLVRECGAVPHLVSCDEVEVERVDHYDRVLLSPGPGLPRESGRLLDVVRRASGRVPVLGVCLGLQAIAEVFGGRLRQLAEVYHGIASPCHITADDALFSGLENPFVVGRYHSWVVDRIGLPACLEITALSPDGEIMALRHRTLDVRGVQFHPESILTPSGRHLLENWLRAGEISVSVGSE